MDKLRVFLARFRCCVAHHPRSGFNVELGDSLDAFSNALSDLDATACTAMTTEETTATQADVAELAPDFAALPRWKLRTLL